MRLFGPQPNVQGSDSCGGLCDVTVIHARNSPCVRGKMDRVVGVWNVAQGSVNAGKLYSNDFLMSMYHIHKT